ncbi:MAG: FAD-dependent monooxygenase [Chloroflexota bacterium]
MSKISIIGGGITGLTTAIGLEQAGYETEVFEAAPAFKPSGAGIIISPNAMQVLTSFGLAKDVQQAGKSIDALRLAKTNGSIMQTAAMQFDGIGSVGIHRGKLHEILLANLKSDVCFGKRLTNISDGENGIHLEFNGDEKQTADVVLAADGIHSAMRQTLFPKSQLRDSGQVCWRGVSDNTAVGEFAGSLPVEIWGAGQRMGIVPLADDQTYWYATDVLASDPITLDDAAEKEHLLNVFADFPAPTLELIKAVPAEKILRHRLNDLAPIPQWHTGSILLLGDAAHAMTPNLGQGAAQGIVDAWTIVGCIKGRATINEAFEQFVALRQKEVNQVVAQCWQIGKVTNIRSSWLSGLRNSTLSLVPASVGDRGRRKLFALPNLSRK